MNNYIEIKGANEHNLKNINIKFPKNKLIAITGISGSGKSTFANDILQRESQRQYMESMGIVTDGLNKAKVHSISGLSPSISISQKPISNNGRSTVGTYSEILTYLRILFAKVGKVTCPNCNILLDPINNYNNQNKKIVCPKCKSELDKLTMANFSFNKIEGACPTCKGSGKVTEIDYSQVVDENLRIKDGAFILWNKEMFGEYYSSIFEKCASYYGFEFNVEKKVKDYNDLEKLVFYKGVDSKEFKKLFPNITPPKKVNDGYVKGITTFLMEKVNSKGINNIKNSKIRNAFIQTSCNSCNGTRLNETARKVFINKRTISEVSTFTLRSLKEWLNSIEFSDIELNIVNPILHDLKKRINNLIQIGLEYLSIDRSIDTLSGGESQRLKLSNIIDSALTGVLYILDEPSSNLHPKDVDKLISQLKHLKNLGNTVIVIEHNIQFIKYCDHIIDFGPYSGNKGGQIIFNGTFNELKKCNNSLTSNFINKEKIIKKPLNYSNEYIFIKNAYEHNLKNIDVKIPLNQIVCITGASGSGKSTLLHNVLYDYTKGKKVKCDNIVGLNNKNIILIDQKSIKGQKRSNLATYTGVYDKIRLLFSKQEKAKQLKLKQSDFSFNVKGGRCENCLGLGYLPINMQFLNDVEVECPICKGKRFKEEVLSVKYNNKSISDILDMSICESIKIFEKEKQIKKILQTIIDVGLGYLNLGQTSNTLSGGECQRLKISKELGNLKSNSIYIFDEPATGLHPYDINILFELFYKLKAKNNSILIIEHSLQAITKCEHIIDLGLEGGEKGGNIIFNGSLKEICDKKESYTSKYIKKYIENN